MADSEIFFALLRCPHCGGGLRPAEHTLQCDACDASFAVREGQPDLRPRVPLMRDVTFTVTPDPLWADGPVVDGPTRDRVDVASLIPRHVSGGRAYALEVGCGSNSLRRQLEAAGWTWIGIDYRAASAVCLADVHALPLESSSFSLVVCKALLEHVRFPPLAARELMRVLTPGGTLIGDVAFLQPYHQSYFHMTHAAVRDLLATAGLQPTLIANAPETPLSYLAKHSGLPRPLRFVVRLATWPADWLFRAFRHLNARLRRRDESLIDLAVGVVFSAVRPRP